ncbi:MAG TPA: cellulase family glycosylhydrolase [Paludibacter sp.]
MKNKITFLPRIFRRSFLFAIIICGLIMPATVKAELPTAQQLAGKMKIGWNLGNMLEATWINYFATTNQRTIDSVKAAGFNTVRLPVAWFYHSNSTTYVIDAAWLAHVKKTIDYCIKDSMYVIINTHWDNGWLDDHINVNDSASVNARQRAHWTQIANYFKDYNDHLLFASANEPPAKDANQMSILLSYHQTFINAVRAVGGNNSSRTLIVQGPSTDIDLTNKLMNTMPKDPIANRLMVEVHYYTPWQFCLLEKDGTNSWEKIYYYWGKDNHSTTDTGRNATWGEESDMDKYLGMMKTKFVDKGIPVIIGEYGAFRKQVIAPSNQALHNASIKSYYRYFVESATKKGIITYCWDTGGIFNFSTGQTKDIDVLSAIMQGAKDATTATPVVLKDGDLKLYPNPFTTTLNLKVDNPADIDRITVFDMMGRQVEAIGHSAVNSSLTLGTSLNSGIYIVQITGKDWTKSIKILKR